MSSLFEQAYNPDVLSCIANLSNDEVFTPPEIANQVLDMLPAELWRDPRARFLDPACKSGVFLREIAKRLISGLEDKYPDLQDRLEHIYREQLFGVAITELTSLLSRRSLYCSKYPNSKYSVVRFEEAEGNIRFKRCEHEWVRDRCVFCGAAKENYDRDDGLETYAYEFIHLDDVRKLHKMKFDVIVGNPPYQLDTGGSGRQAKPLYNLFVEQAKKLNPRYIAMIIPSRWFAGGMGMDSFRKEMMHDRRVAKLVDFANAKDCFPQNSISGGVCYFLWDRSHDGDCEFVNVSGNVFETDNRYLDEFPVLVRYNKAVSILRKIQLANEPILTELVSPISPFGIPTNVRGQKSPESPTDIRVLSSQGMGYLPIQKIDTNKPYFGKYKVAVSQTGAEHACEPDKDGQFKVLASSMRCLDPTDVCTHSYLVVGLFDSLNECNHLLNYLKTKFVRFLILQAVSSIHISRQTFCFVPIQDFSKEWSDEELYEKYDLSAEEIDFIDSIIKPMMDYGNE